jgi:RNA polymerase sigma-70 factor, ECF subfamily
VPTEPCATTLVHLVAMAVLAPSVAAPERRGVPDDDARLMERIRDGDQPAFILLVERYQHELVGFFYHHCWSQLIAEELAQDVFWNVYRSRERYQPTAKLRTYLYRIAHNLWIDHVRRQRHQNVSLEAAVGNSTLRLVDVLAADEPQQGELDPTRDATLRTRIQQAVDALPQGQKDVFVLANHQDMKYQEIAVVLGIPEGTVKSRMHSAVRFLRDELQDLVEP